MKEKHISTYITSIFLLLSLTLIAQETAKDSLGYQQRYGLRIGIDLSKPIRSFLNDNYRGLELMGDYRLTQRHYIAAEIGTEENTIEDEYISFSSKGNYLKVGFDYNTYENWYGMENMIFAGARYGFGTFNQTLNSYSIYNQNHYWQEDQSSGRNPDLLKEYSGLTAHWLEVVVGLKAELFNNLYLGASLRLNYLVTDSSSDAFPALWIPGFNKVIDDSKFGVGFNYGLTYFLPLYKKSKKSEIKD